jgi:hypothetical protein
MNWICYYGPGKQDLYLSEGSGSFSCYSTPHPEDVDPERSEGETDEGSLTMMRNADQAGYVYILTNRVNSVLYTKELPS